MTVGFCSITIIVLFAVTYLVIGEDRIIELPLIEKRVLLKRMVAVLMGPLVVSFLISFIEVKNNRCWPFEK